MEEIVYYAWEGKQTPELEEALGDYAVKFGDMADSWAGIEYDLFSYEQFLELVKYCIANNKPIDEIWEEETGFPA